MGDIDNWQALGVVCGAILTAATLVNLAWRKVIRPMWRALRTAYQRANDAVDIILGDEVKGIPGLAGRLAKLELAQAAALELVRAEHASWHAPPGAMPARPYAPRPNGGGSGRRQQR